MKDSIIIVSGGMDSITMLYEYKDRIALGVSFNYGSNHNQREIPFAEMHCKRLGIPHITIDLAFMPQYLKSSLLEGADAIPEGNYDNENMKSTVVPFVRSLSRPCQLPPQPVPMRMSRYGHPTPISPKPISHVMARLLA